MKRRSRIRAVARLTLVVAASAPLALSSGVASAASALQPAEGKSVGELFSEGQTKFDAGAFNEAIELWRQAYEMVPEDDTGNRLRVQYYLADAHYEAYGVDGDIAHVRTADRLFSAYEEAAEIDEGTQAKIDAKQVKIKQWLEEEREREAARLEKEQQEAALKEAQREEAEALAAKRRLELEEAQQGPLSPRVRKALLISGSVTTVVGAGLLGVMGYGLYAGSNADEEGAVARDQEPLDRDLLQQIRVEGENANTLAIATGVAGGVVTAAGIAMIITSRVSTRSSRSSEVSVLPGFSRRGAGVSLHMRF